MVCLRTILFTTILLAGNVFAARINYFCNWNKADNEITDHTTKAGGSCTDKEGNAIIAQMASVSGGAYTASRHARSGIITVKNAARLASKDGANGEIQRMQQHVNAIKATVSRTPSPEPAKKKSPSPPPSPKKKGSKGKGLKGLAKKIFGKRASRKVRRSNF